MTTADTAAAFQTRKRTADILATAETAENKADDTRRKLDEATLQSQLAETKRSAAAQLMSKAGPADKMAAHEYSEAMEAVAAAAGVFLALCVL